ncbi:hypothetical protein QN366_21895 [Pseudomonas sp. CCC3.2]|uniref:hypothetical protein n=1 Tax=unclassified Pseudomonas TaxID=196821 RepID=UPI002AB51D57|nr:MULTISPECIES: hypothetical protein [unclassified Pseudomonas]MDY7560889.1 hypothetical protein [Pseudomonas sp. AB6]MEB0182695.1 hypothetical protein [Pseudomonas sp. CCC3.2]MEB0213277.1 hypothetical protein [Pseudomonas sp. AB6]
MLCLKVLLTSYEFAGANTSQTRFLTSNTIGLQKKFKTSTTASIGLAKTFTSYVQPKQNGQEVGDDSPNERTVTKDQASNCAFTTCYDFADYAGRITQQALREVDTYWRSQLSAGNDDNAKLFLDAAPQTFTNDVGEQQNYSLRDCRS